MSLLRTRARPEALQYKLPRKDYQKYSQGAAYMNLRKMLSIKGLIKH